MGRRNKEWFKAYAPQAEEIAFKQMKDGAASPRVQHLRQVALEKASQPRSLAEMVELLTPDQVATYLKCSVDHVYDLIKSHELICQPDKSRKVIPVTRLHDYLVKEQRKMYG